MWGLGKELKFWATRARAIDSTRVEKEAAFSLDDHSISEHLARIQLRDLQHHTVRGTVVESERKRRTLQTW